MNEKCNDCPHLATPRREFPHIIGFCMYWGVAVRDDKDTFCDGVKE